MVMFAFKVSQTTRVVIIEMTSGLFIVADRRLLSWYVALPHSPAASQLPVYTELTKL